jgi:peroxiredoxin
MPSTAKSPVQRSRLSVAALMWLAGVAWGAAYGPLGAPAPDFTLRAFGGGNIRLSEQRGDVVVLSFWGSRCASCPAQLALLDRSFTTYRTAGLQMYGIGVDDDPVRAQAFAADHRVGFTLLADPGKDVARRYEVDNLPMTVLIDRDGVVRDVYRDFGVHDEARYLAQLRKLLNE